MHSSAHIPHRFHKTVIALAAGLALVPHGADALSLSQSPPGTQQPFVAPNVIISMDDSGSMAWALNNGTVDATITAPDAITGLWNPAAPRINILRHALNQVFNDTTLLPDGKIRLAWQSMWSDSYMPNAYRAGNVNAPGSKINSMKVLDPTHRANFLDFINRLTPWNNTPTHLMFAQADAYMRRPLDVNSPWASVPGTTDQPYLGCRRNYHIMMTDGQWNGAISGGSQDDNTVDRTLPDGTVYGSSNAASRPNNRLYHDTFADTVSDWAFRSWADPLQPAASLTGSLQHLADYLKAPATENFGNDGAGTPAILNRYWNPRYNPATWPHMVTYTIGVSNDATTWGAGIVAATQRVPFGYDNGFRDLVTGRRSWPNVHGGNRALDMWHAALNGRGRFYAVQQAQHLEQAFRDIFDQINSAVQAGTGSTAASGASITRNDVGMFTASFDPINAWRGAITAEQVQKDGSGNVSVVSHPGWGGQNSAAKLDALTNLNSRAILTWNDKWNISAPTGGTPFRWASDESKLSTEQKLWLQKNPSTNADDGATVGNQRLEFIRGDRSQESPGGSFRTRTSRQGDIVNSDVWYVGAPSSNYPLKGYLQFTGANKLRTSMIYVGGNDGMLHGFSANDGSEKIAYVPRGAIPTLNELTDPAYDSAHRYYVDGSPMTGDVDLGMSPGANDGDTSHTPNWRTLLVGTLGAGGKGYFVLDVTDPSSFSEANAASLVKMDRTRGSAEPAPNCAAMTDPAEKNACNLAVAEDADIGHIAAKPVRDEANRMRATQITRMNNNRWAVVLGNGYNSTNQRPVLLIQYLDGDKKLKLIPATTDLPGTGNAADNGLASPRLVDLNGDGRTDLVYAGDNLGNMWKFDLTSDAETDWNVTFASKPLFTARGSASLGSSTRPKVQPISAAPTVRANDRMMDVGTGPTATTQAVGGMMVAFGTGRNVTTADATNVDVQTLYSVLDNTQYRYRSPAPTMGKRLEVHPGGGTVPVPTAAGTMGNGGVLTGGSKLAEQKITAVTTPGYGTVDAVQQLDKTTWSNYRGWFMDYTAIGERQLKPIEFYDGSNILAVYSQVPARGSNTTQTGESCNTTTALPERQFRTFINIMDGKRPTVQLVDMTGDGQFTAADLGVSHAEVSGGSHTIVTQGNRNVDIDQNNKLEKLNRMPEQSLRPSWRQLK